MTQQPKVEFIRGKAPSTLRGIKLMHDLQTINLKEVPAGVFEYQPPRNIYAIVHIIDRDVNDANGDTVSKRPEAYTYRIDISDMPSSLVVYREHLQKDEKIILATFKSIV